MSTADLSIDAIVADHVAHAHHVQSAWVDLDDAPAPAIIQSIDRLGLDANAVYDLTLRAAHAVPRFSTDDMADRLCLARSIVAETLESLLADRMIEVLGPDGPFSYRWTATDRGRERAMQISDHSRYVGPAPVTIDEYTDRIAEQFDRLAAVRPTDAEAALAALVLPDAVRQIAGLAVASRRSLFLHGPAGNGKTSIGHLLHRAMRGSLWIPHAIAVGHQVITLFDPQVHTRTDGELTAEQWRRIDRRWVRIERPFVVTAGDLRMSDLDLAYSEATRTYEAPLHVKANGGIFLLDDFGRQQIDPQQILNRWVFPLENGTDYLTLRTGQKLPVPFHQMLIVSTNLDPEKVMDAAFLRRMGYRLLVPHPEPELYADIFHRYAASRGVQLAERVIDGVIERYIREGRAMRSCEPRDLIERACDICRYRDVPAVIDHEIIGLAWRGYFGG